MKDIICEKCGAKMKVDTSAICASIPPRYRCKCPDCGYLDFINTSEYDATVETTNVFDWQSFRREAAKDILCSVVANPGRIGNVEYGRKDYRQSEYVRFAIDCADELIKQLKQE